MYFNMLKSLGTQKTNVFGEKLLIHCNTNLKYELYYHTTGVYYKLIFKLPAHYQYFVCCDIFCPVTLLWKKNIVHRNDDILYCAVFFLRKVG